MHIQQQIGLKVERTLGKGSFATVYFCRDSSLSSSYAVKVFHKKDFTKTKLNSFRKEAQILASIQHKNIVKFHSFKETQNCLYLIMEYISGGTLRNIMETRWARKHPFSDEEASKIIKCLLEGIKYLHKYNIIHRDLKPGMYFDNYENILVADPGDFTALKIIDFGLSAQVDNSSSKNVKAQCGTLLYMAPQILYQPSYNKSVDIWSCAIITYILCTNGKHPIHHPGMKTEEYKQKLKSCKFPQLENVLAQNFIQRISRIDYTERYSVNEALQHPWITRNYEDEVPLSVNESVQSFDVSHQIKNLIHLCYYAGKEMKKTSWEVPDDYRRKVNQFTLLHEDYRSHSPSYKKIGKKTQQVFFKIRQILNHQTKPSQDPKSIQDEIPSPLIRRHQKLYLRLFQKSKISEFDETINEKKSLFELCTPISIKSPRKDQQFFTEDNLKQTIYEKQKEETIQIKENSMIQQKIKNIEINSPTKKKQEKKEKFPSKINASRMDCSSKVDTNLANLKRKNIYKKPSLDLRDSSFYKRNSRKTLEKQELNSSMTSPKKPNTAGGTRNTFGNKSRHRPMMFGMNSLFN